MHVCVSCCLRSDGSLGSDGSKDGDTTNLLLSADTDHRI